MSSNNVRHLISKTITTLQHFSTLNHTSPNYTYRHFTILSFGLTHLHFLPFYFTSHHCSPISKLISKIMNLFTALNNLSSFHFTSIFFTFFHLSSQPFTSLYFFIHIYKSLPFTSLPFTFHFLSPSLPLTGSLS
jgi:hypothetical protein